MTSPDFTLELGIGQYIDSDGRFHTHPPAGIPVYQVPGGGLLSVFPTLQKVFGGGTASALGSTRDALEDLAKYDEKAKQFTSDSAKYLLSKGVNPNFLAFMGTCGKIVRVLALAAVVASVAVTVIGILIDILGLGGDKDAALKTYLDKWFHEVEELIIGLEVLHRKQELVRRQINFDNSNNQLKTHVRGLKDFPNDPLDKVNERIRLLGETYTIVRDELQNLAASVSWEVPFNKEEHRYPFALWDSSNFMSEYDTHFADNRWVADVDHGDGRGFVEGPVAIGGPMVVVPDRTVDFDHRMLVPWVTYGVQTYLTLALALVPEYRSTGAFREDLTSLVRVVEDLSIQMRSKLARTRYQPEDFRYVMRSHVISGHPDPMANSFGPRNPFAPPLVLDPRTSLLTGAIDLCAHTTAYFNAEWKKQEYTVSPLPSQLGHLHLNWMPPYELSENVINVFRLNNQEAYAVTNAQECAAAANAVADEEYALLLVTSGYLNLVHLTALLRHQLTEPLQSETVSGNVSVLRFPQPDVPITVQSEQIALVPGDGRIRASATLIPQEFSAKGRVKTQPLGGRPLQYDHRLEYRIVLRTLVTGESAPQYAEYFTTYYHQPDPAIPDYTVAARVNSQVLVDEHVLLTWTPSPSDTIVRPSPGESARIELQAHTFDLYVPTPPVFTSTAGMVPAPSYTKLPETLSIFSVADNLRWPISVADKPRWSNDQRYMVIGDSSEPAGQPRAFMAERVHIAYRMSWHGDQLELELTGEPSDRNYFVFLVIEEALAPGNPQGVMRHSSFRITMANRSTMVPRSFFDEEARAEQHAEAVLSEIAKKYPRGEVHVGPGDPIMKAVNDGALKTIEGQRNFVHIAEKYAPGVFHETVDRAGLFRASRDR